MLYHFELIDNEVQLRWKRKRLLCSGYDKDSNLRLEDFMKINLP